MIGCSSLDVDCCVSLLGVVSYVQLLLAESKLIDMSQRTCQSYSNKFSMANVMQQISKSWKPSAPSRDNWVYPEQCTHGIYCVLYGFLGIIIHKYPLYRAYIRDFP